MADVKDNIGDGDMVVLIIIGILLLITNIISLAVFIGFVSDIALCLDEIKSRK